MLHLTLSTGPIYIAVKHIVALIQEPTKTRILTSCGVTYYVKETVVEIGKMNVWEKWL